MTKLGCILTGGHEWSLVPGVVYFGSVPRYKWVCVKCREKRVSESDTDPDLRKGIK